MGGVALSLPAIRQSGLLRTADRLCVEFSQDFAYHTSKYTCNLDKHATRGGINKMRIWSSPDLKGCISRKHYVDATRLSARSDLPLGQRYRRPQQRGGKSATWVRGSVHAITRFFSWSRFRSFFSTAAAFSIAARRRSNRSNARVASTEVHNVCPFLLLSPFKSGLLYALGEEPFSTLN